MQIFLCISEKVASMSVRIYAERQKTGIAQKKVLLILCGSHQVSVAGTFGRVAQPADWG